MNIQKAAIVTGSGVPSDAQLVKINALCKTPLQKEDIYCFCVRLCDDQPDRDNERFDTAALPRLAELFRGKTGILDHDWSTQNQVARIFDTEVCRDDGIHYIRAECYLLRTEKNADLIREIEGGIKKEISVGCAMGRTVCSICGQEYGLCEHHKGAVYATEPCVAVLCDPVDAYEFSFVAVPAQREAGVIKALEGGVAMTLEQLVTKSGLPELCDRLRTLEQEAQFGRDCQKALVREAVSLCMLLDFGGEEADLEKAFSALEPTALTRLRDAMKKKAAELFPPTPQLPAAKSCRNSIDTAYII